MTNAFYNAASGVPTAGSFGRSAPARAEFAQIADGFDGVEAALATKAPTSNPVFTGSVTLPPVALSEVVLSKAATLQYVLDVLGAGGALIPPTAGNAGKVLQTLDGVSYSWQMLLPPPAGNARKVAVVNSAGTAYEVRSMTAIGDGGIIQISGMVTLDGTKTVVDFSASAAGALAIAPDATTLPVGFSLLLSASPTGANTAGLVDAAGELVHSPAAAEGSIAVLTSNASAAGQWSIISEKLAVSAVSGLRYAMGPITVTAAASTEAAIKAMLKVGTDQVLLATGDTTTDSITLKWLDVVGLNVSVRHSVSFGGGGAGAVFGVHITDTGNGSFLVTYQTGTTLKACAVTLAGSTITAGAVVTVQAGTGAGADNDLTAVACNGGKVAWVCGIGGSGSCVVIGGEVTGGTTVTVGSSVAYNAAGQGGRAVIKAMPTTAGKFVMVGCPQTNAIAHVVTVTGTTPSLGAASVTAVAGGVTPIPALHLISDTVGLMAYNNSSNSITLPLTINPSLNTVAAGSAVTWGAGLAAGVTNYGNRMFVFDGGTKAVFAAMNGSATTLSMRAGTIDPATGIVTPIGSVSTITTSGQINRSQFSEAPGLGMFIGAYNNAGLRFFSKAGVLSSVVVDTGLATSTSTSATAVSYINPAVMLDSTRLVTANTDAAADVSVRVIKFGGLQ